MQQRVKVIKENYWAEKTRLRDLEATLKNQKA